MVNLCGLLIAIVPFLQIASGRLRPQHSTFLSCFHRSLLEKNWKTNLNKNTVAAPEYLKIFQVENMKIGFCVLLSNIVQAFLLKVHCLVTLPYSKLWSFLTSLLKHTSKLSNIFKCAHAPVHHVWNWTITSLSQNVTTILGTLLKSKLLFHCQIEWYHHPLLVFLIIIVFTSVVFTTSFSLIQSQNTINKIACLFKSINTSVGRYCAVPWFQVAQEKGRTAEMCLFNWQIACTALGSLCCTPAGKYRMREKQSFTPQKYQGFKIFLPAWELT